MRKLFRGSLFVAAWTGAALLQAWYFIPHNQGKEIARPGQAKTAEVRPISVSANVGTSSYLR